MEEVVTEGGTKQRKTAVPMIRLESGKNHRAAFFRLLCCFRRCVCARSTRSRDARLDPAVVWFLASAERRSKPSDSAREGVVPRAMTV